MARLSKTDIANIAALAENRKLDPAAVLAVVRIESAGLTGSIVQGRLEPIIRFEGHYFDKRLSAAERRTARIQGLASPNAGAIKNPVSQTARYAMLDRARAINEKAAIESVSWGVGQVMGSHWKALGYQSAVALMATARAGLAGQVSLMLDFIETNNLSETLNAHDWKNFSRRYNGPNYAKNRYDTKLAKAYGDYKNYLGETARAASQSKAAKRPLLIGAKGQSVQTLQQLLTAAGFVTQADGVFGPATQRVLEDFQRTHGLKVDGIYGSATASKLQSIVPTDSQTEKRMNRLLKWLQFFLRLFLK